MHTHNYTETEKNIRTRSFNRDYYAFTALHTRIDKYKHDIEIKHRSLLVAVKTYKFFSRCRVCDSGGVGPVVVEPPVSPSAMTPPHSAEIRVWVVREVVGDKRVRYK